MVNKKYDFLDDLEELHRQRLVKSRAQLADEYSKKTGIPKATLVSCLKFREERYFSKEVRAQFKVERVHKK